MQELHDQQSRAAIAAHPGYVRLVLPTQHARARAACQKFSELCQEESARAGLILTRSSDADPAELESQMALATRRVLPGFKLAIVAQGADAASIRRIVGASAARRRAKAKAFPSEHRAAAWLIG